MIMKLLAFPPKYFPVLLSSDISQHHRLSFKMGTILGTIQQLRNARKKNWYENEHDTIFSLRE